jgi:hypothetical protein
MRSLCGLGLAALVVFGTLLIGGATGASQSASNRGTIKVGDPTKDGSITIEIRCEYHDGGVESTEVTVPILADDDASTKAAKIRDAIRNMAPDCFVDYYLGNGEISLAPVGDNTVIGVKIVRDDTCEPIGTKVTAPPKRTTGKAGFEGTPNGGGQAAVKVGETTGQTSTTGKTLFQIVLDIFNSLVSQGVDAVFSENEIWIQDDLTDVMLTASNTDSGLTLNLSTEAWDAAGGMARLPDVASDSSSSTETYAGLAGGAVATLAVVACAWCARRRWRG